ncbi:MAG TPA: protein kinase [Candidatus Sulfotelmatobacter sp.]|nr:protein kinase [Candidatus Sulfotelmatobacter sp.]
MSLSSGTKLGPYEIQAPLGAGGMGEVYRARDTRLDRIVAVKILPEHLSGPEARQRFDREARSISSLSHPNVCHLYDVGQQDGIHYLVMEYLEGETLADRLRKGPLPLDQVLKVGIEICEGLEAAHRKGVVHRDLKPGNVMLTKSGAKLMDFGLAKAAQATPASTLTQTLTAPQHPVTTKGTVVGTFQYMSPEQVEGTEADTRSDIFALGAVLYEMVTGKMAFEGKTAASTIAAILAAQPKPLSTAQPMTPPSLDLVVRTCLAKDPDERWQSAADVGRQLGWLSDGPPSAVITPRSRRGTSWMVAGIAGLAVAAGAFWLGSSRREASPAVQFQVVAPDKTYFNFRGLSGPPTSSPDGKNIVFAAYWQGQQNARSLWLRSLSSSEVHMIAGSEGGTYPFWSPDGSAVGFFADGKLKRFDLVSSSVMTLCDAAEGRGGAWATNGVILFGARADSLFRVDAAGGKALRLTTLDAKLQETSHRWPQFLPDQKHFLYISQAPAVPLAHMMVASLDSPQGKPLAEDVRYGTFSAGFLFYMQESDLLARRFDPDRLEFAGDSTVLARQVQADPQFNFGAFSVSPSVLTYQTGAVAAATWLVQIDRTGKEQILWKETGLLQNIALSPNGEQIAADVGLSSGQLADIWIYNLPKHNSTRLTFDQHSSGSVWSPDGSKIALSRQTDAGSQIVIKSVSGGGDEQVIINEDQRTLPLSWSSDGRYLFYRRGMTLAGEIKAVALTGEHKVVKLLDIRSTASAGSLSPDSKWLAYVSADSGSQQDVYVVPFHANAEDVGLGQGKWQITSGGSAAPMWRGDGKEIYFSTSSYIGIASVQLIASGDHLEVGPMQTLFDLGAHPISRFFAPSRDGQRFYGVTYGPGSDAPFTVTLNWQSLLKK